MRVFGKYRLLEPIASGGMAEVWRAEVPGAEGFVKQVALKLIRGDHDAHGDFVSMFIREARLASRLAHGNIVQVFDFDQVDGRYYIAMELIRGRTLRQVVDRCRERGVRFGLARAVHVCAEVARALAYAHRTDDGAVPGGVVHRDVSPQNVLLSFEGEVKLTDFGIARALHSAEVTSPGTVKGKLAYMAPEQARGSSVDARADVFSVGVILWELCTGRRLFARDSDAAMLAAVVAPEPISPPSAWNEAVPPELDAVVLGALARDPSQRTATAETLASALASLRLRLAASHEDLDVRALLRRLWPEGDVATRALQPERTAVREALADAHGAGAPGGVGAPTPEALRAPLASPGVADDVPTRTATEAPAYRPPGRARWIGVGAAILVTVAAASAWWGWARSGRPTPVSAGTRLAREPTEPRAPGAAEPPPSGDEVHAHPAEFARPAPAAPATPVTPAAPVTPTAPAEPVTSPRLESAPAREAPPGAPPPATAAVPRAPLPLRPGAASPEPRWPVAAPVERGTIVVRATPWAYVSIDGIEAGDTPVDAAVSAAEHHLHAHHPSLGDDDLVVKLAPGERFVWRPRLSR